MAICCCAASTGYFLTRLSDPQEISIAVAAISRHDKGNNAMSERTIVISQPMYFPWVGMFEQLKLADDYVDYTDVAFSKGSFTNRVQVKTHTGIVWLTLPLKDLRLGQPVSEVMLDERQNWRRRHRSTLAQAYAKAPFVSETLALVDEVFESTSGRLADVAFHSMVAVHRYFGFERPFRYHRSSELGIGGSGSERVLKIVQSLGGNVYITGHGARNYLDHEAFETNGVAVEYMNYLKIEYPQMHPPFTPYVTVLDLVANMGREARTKIVSGTNSWRNLPEPKASPV